MKKLLWIVAVLFSLAVIHSCISKSNIDIEIPPQQKEIIVECFLTPGYPAALTLTESINLDDELDLWGLDNAKAYIITDSGAIQLNGIFSWDSARRVYVNYSSKDTIHNNHSFFTLDITNSQGIRLYASTNIVSQVEMQNINLERNAITVHYKTSNAGEQYFKLLASIYKSGKHKETKFGLYDQNDPVTDSCSLPWKEYKADADSVVVTLYHIQKDYYEYLLSVRNASSAYKDPFLTPEAIKSNINGGIGIFTYYTFDKRGFAL
ncbi:DUF4249 domain-containing protein [Chitinophagaceae bacterium LB-8]|uniref:DUF4249 domain-containing protein n=1 Tax=Paraflavisolibacter caeni TaxID=2982496 RepID=A0A9X3B8F5_9BACT|nr:DUF4249 family protein [Paraflavisolibacter caeni]MCU7549711.1 DUF4249 domain-containing protein [Paraflavisolibacter caeni]